MSTLISLREIRMYYVVESQTETTLHLSGLDRDEIRKLSEKIILAHSVDYETRIICFSGPLPDSSILLYLELEGVQHSNIIHDY